MKNDRVFSNKELLDNEEALRIIFKDFDKKHVLHNHATNETGSFFDLLLESSEEDASVMSRVFRDMIK